MYAVLALLAVLAAACGGGSQTAAPSTTGTRTTGSQHGSSDGAHRSRVEYPGGGPVDDPFPPRGRDPYSLIASGQCAGLLSDTQSWSSEVSNDDQGASTTPLYQSAAYACLGRWDDALRVYDQIHAGNPDFKKNTCARDKLLAWLTPLIDARRHDSNFSPVFVKSSATSPCPSDESTSTSGESTSSTSSATSISTETTTSTAQPEATTG